MRWRDLLTLELRSSLRRSLLMCGAVTLSIALVVALATISVFWEKAIEREVDSLGANVLVLPMTAEVSDYYAADLQAGEIPESYVTLLATSNLRGLDNVSPKLALPVEVAGQRVILTGILPTEEFRAKAAWAGAGIFARPNGCGAVDDVLGLTTRNQAPARTIETLDEESVLVGADAARRLQIAEGQKIAIAGAMLQVTAILPPTGTVDDARIFAHLHTAQRIGDKEGVINAIEIVGCCKEISQGLVAKLNGLLPEAKVVTISHLVDAQLKTSTTMHVLSLFLSFIVAVLCALMLVKEFYTNARDRRVEMGILLAMGAPRKYILRLFMAKAAFIGALGGLAGYLIGTIVAAIIGPLVTQVPVLPLWSLLLVCTLLSTAICAFSAYWPARRAALLDPCTLLRRD